MELETSTAAADLVQLRLVNIDFVVTGNSTDLYLIHRTGHVQNCESSQCKNRLT